MNRQRQLWVLITLTAITMVPQYALQGWLATGGEIPEIANWVYFVDAGAWSLRAIIEPLVLAFLFSIQAQAATAQERKILLAFEVALIGLITLTLGPTLAAIGLKLSIKEALPIPFYWLWNFGIASYAPLMLGAMGFAFKLETRQHPTTTPVAKPVVARAKQEHNGIATKPQRRKANDKDAAIIQTIETEGKALQNSTIAKAIDLSPSATSRRLAKLVDIGQLLKTDEGYTVANGVK